MATPHAPKIRSLYRRLLRELPARKPQQSILSDPSPIQKHVRASISTRPSSDDTNNKPIHLHLDDMEQYVQYVKAQRMYITLLERYNPGMNMAEEDRVRLTARRVGMDLPPELRTGKE